MVENAKVVIVDIEGTTTPIAFVKQVLFPFILNTIHAFLRENINQESFKPFLQDLANQSEKDVAQGLIESPVGPLDLDTDDSSTLDKLINSVVDYVKWQMSIDRKIGPLKNLQGRIWKAAYERGDIKGQVYSDVVEAFKEWKSKQKSIYVYSSGSVAAQKLLFGYSDQGDLLEYFSGHFGELYLIILYLLTLYRYCNRVKDCSGILY